MGFPMAFSLIPNPEVFRSFLRFQIPGFFGFFSQIIPKRKSRDFYEFFERFEPAGISKSQTFPDWKSSDFLKRIFFGIPQKFRYFQFHAVFFGFFLRLSEKKIRWQIPQKTLLVITVTSYKNSNQINCSSSSALNLL